MFYPFLFYMSKYFTQNYLVKGIDESIPLSLTIQISSQNVILSIFIFSCEHSGIQKSQLYSFLRKGISFQAFVTEMGEKPAGKN